MYPGGAAISRQPISFNQPNIFIPGSFLSGEMCSAENKYEMDPVHGPALRRWEQRVGEQMQGRVGEWHRWS